MASWYRRQRKEAAATMKSKDAEEMVGGPALDPPSGGRPLPPAAGQLSLPLLFCSEAVALVRFPASLFRTLSRVCELSRICRQTCVLVTTVPPSGTSHQASASPWGRSTEGKPPSGGSNRVSRAPFPSESSPKPLPRALESQARLAPASGHAGPPEAPRAPP